MRAAAASVAVLAALVLLAPPAAAGADRRAVLVLGAPGIPYEDALAQPALVDLAARGGIGLMTTRAEEETPEAAVRAVVAGDPDAQRERLVEALEDAGRTVAFVEGGDPVEDADLLVMGPVAEPGAALEALVPGLAADEVLVVVAFPWPSDAMRAAGDVVTPLVLGRGDPRDLLDGGGSVAGLTSATTRRQGLVANVDVAPTLLSFLGAARPAGMVGAAIEAEGGPPGPLHERYLGLRRIRVPLQIGILGLALAALIAASLFLARPLEAPATARALGAWTVVGISVPVASYVVGALPSITWLTALVTVVLVGTGIALLASRLGRTAPTAAPAFVGAIAVSLLAADAALGWRAMLMPVIGGGALEGGRYYGIGNVWAGVLVAGAVLLAAHLTPWAGAALLATAGLFAGFPGMGANFGASVTLFAAAGLWLALRVRGRIGTVEGALAAAVTAAGAGVVVLAHRLFGPETDHIARASGAGAAGALETLWRRLAINLEVTSQVPVAWLVLAVLGGAAVLAWRRWGPLAADPAWRDACLVLAVAGLVGWLVNDTGIGVAGLSLLFLAAALAYPALSERWTTG